ncbi:MAG: type II toxin-antitoxin system RelB/DinJ family antitoxin [Candidatus Methanomethylophilaceae archaeon]|nr:type II toxin-antitoxin system RelB/DinJ family antitoxin [Candidatus Methanomethylophilaceae archaeon]
MPYMYGNVEKALREAVEKGVSGKRIGVAFSGGLDSGLVSAIAKEYAESVTLYTCGTANAYDVVMARDLSQKLGLPWVHVQISKGMIEGTLREMIEATGISDPFTLSYEMQLFSVCKAAKEDIILTGQGADEYFMGCAKFVNQTDRDYQILKEDSVDRLLTVSVPAEYQIADYFKKTLVYPYLDPGVVKEVEAIDSEELRPKDMDSRKSVLKEIAANMGHTAVLDRKKKSSQYGSGTTDLVRGIAKERGKMYNEYIADLYDSVTYGVPSKYRGSVINVRIDSVVRAKAGKILQENGLTPSEAVERMFLKIIDEGNIDFLKKE